jgi:4,5-DOPA dioxygenase extradiol
MITLPAIFFGHGSPMNAIENNRYTKSWIEVIKKIPKPKTILAISAHFESDGIKITSNKKQKTIHDFYGFPQQLFDVKYEPKGDIKLAERIQKLIPETQLDDSWGIDHGTWSVLKHTFPQANIPTIQLSIDKNKTPREHYELAKNLRILREEEILIIGSGDIVHNLRLMNWRSNQAYSWAIEFNELIKKAILEKDHEKIINFHKLVGAAESVPTIEHFIPLLYILALQKDDEKAEIFADGIEFGSIAMTSVAIY